MKNFIDTRWGQYMLHVIVFGVLWKVAGVEFTAVLMGACALGELSYHTDRRFPDED